MSKTISYRAGYKYQLAYEFSLLTPIKPAKDIATEYIDLDRDGKLTIRNGYAWDGVSGPVVDTQYNLRASLVHDAFYQLMRTEPKKLPKGRYKIKSDRLFRDMCIEDGVLPIFAETYYEVLKKLGDPFADPKNIKEVKKAPK